MDQVELMGLGSFYFCVRKGEAMTINLRHLFILLGRKKYTKNFNHNIRLPYRDSIRGPLEIQNRKCNHYTAIACVCLIHYSVTCVF